MLFLNVSSFNRLSPLSDLSEICSGLSILCGIVYSQYGFKSYPKTCRNSAETAVNFCLLTSNPPGDCQKMCKNNHHNWGKCTSWQPRRFFCKLGSTQKGCHEYIVVLNKCQDHPPRFPGMTKSIIYQKPPHDQPKWSLCGSRQYQNF